MSSPMTRERPTMRRLQNATRLFSRLLGAGVAVALATMSMSVLSTQVAGAATAPGNSGAAHACQQGGYVNYSTTTGATFTNTGECVSYAAKGGTLVALPDLVLIPTCTAVLGSEGCAFTVDNIGIGPVTNGTVVVEETASGDGLSVPAESTCTGTFPPGSITPCPVAPIAVSVFFFGLPSGTSVSITAVVNPDHSIVESNYANNSFSQTFVVS
jgi:hypothetical protein